MSDLPPLLWVAKGNACESLSVSMFFIPDVGRSSPIPKNLSYSQCAPYKACRIDQHRCDHLTFEDPTQLIRKVVYE